ncbi:unnamed protein product [Mycena citricolor]|uniref:Uncharacterized protein n=1 Tax=Mycena citricolor TaxID=2018698 RepID=A0AAD2HYF8_9AGAR|nr:unnamed protein product [Mycena citricolor]
MPRRKRGVSTGLLTNCVKRKLISKSDWVRCTGVKLFIQCTTIRARSQALAPRTPCWIGSLVVTGFHLTGALHRAQCGRRFWSLLQYYEHLFCDVHTRIRIPSKWSYSTPVFAGQSPSHRTIARHAPARPL